MVHSGLDCFLQSVPPPLRGKRVGVLCHQASITSGLEHILDACARHPAVHVAAVFGPQHGLYGQTQANMIEWEGGYLHPLLKVPVFSLYGRHRRPTPQMLEGLDAIIVDLCDVGARLYTYAWTVKHCMEACAASGIPLVVLDRPNPIAALGFDGPLLAPDHFSFVGAAGIPMCHRMTLGELARFCALEQGLDLDLHVVPLRGWQRDSLWSETGLPWVLPSPNIPTPGTTLVYPGTVLLEGTNVSEGRGTTRPFEFFGAPWLDCAAFRACMERRPRAGWVLREHGFVPVFDKHAGTFCCGFELLVTDPRGFAPVTVGAFLCDALLRSCNGAFAFLPPPYEYEREKPPFDILAGDPSLRCAIERGEVADDIGLRWARAYGPFLERFHSCALYPEHLP